MSDQFISMKQMRENFPEYKAGLEQGKTYTIIYRSKPLARLTPISSGPKYTKEDIEKVRKLAGGVSGGKDLTPEKLNKLIDDSYEDVLS